MQINGNVGKHWVPVNNAGRGNANIDLMQGVNSPIVLKRDALVSGAMRLPGGGLLNAHVFEAEGSTPESPIMRVKGTNTCGTAFDVEIHINDLNKHNLSFIEMFALDGYRTLKTGETSGIARGVGQALFNSDLVLDGFTQFDVVSALRDALASHRENRNWDAAAWVDGIIDEIVRHFVRA